MRLNPGQELALYLSLVEQIPEIHLLTGVGFGKTTTLGAWQVPNIAIPGSQHLLCAPTVSMMRTATLRKVEQAWREFGGFRHGIDYVINQRMPGVRPFSGIGSENVITFRWGSYVVLTSLENFNTVNGSEWDTIAVDEVRDVRHTQEAFDKLRARLRNECYSRMGLKHKFISATTPPDNPAYFRELMEQQAHDPDIRFITGTSWDNAHNLPAGYVERLQKTLDPVSYRREVLGELITAQSNIYAYALDLRTHVKEIQAIPELPLYISIDFNVSPMTAILAQHTPDKKRIMILDELRLINSDVYELSEHIMAKWLPNVSRGRFTGDSSGDSRTALKKGITNWKAIRNTIGFRDGQLTLLTRNPFDADYSQLLNSILARHPSITIHPRCKYLIRDLELTQRGDDSEIIASDALSGHLFDCLKYYLWTHHYDFLDKFRERKMTYKTL